MGSTCRALRAIKTAQKQYSSRSFCSSVRCQLGARASHDCTYIKYLLCSCMMHGVPLPCVKDISRCVKAASTSTVLKITSQQHNPCGSHTAMRELHWWILVWQ
jgi:benzoyl-CoA reductase/2-hydroxyglutaryl-CoA dehydratase subunit BcrC/BadD/HgdB